MSEARCAWCGGSHAKTANYRIFCSRYCHYSFETWSMDRAVMRRHAVQLWRTGMRRHGFTEELAGSILPAPKTNDHFRSLSGTSATDCN